MELPFRPRWGPVLVAAALAFAVALATPYLALPVGTATATGASMGEEGMQILVYVDHQWVGVDVGDRVIYRADGALVHHRVVGVTEAGYVTKGDAVAVTDQAVGLPYATDANIVGVVVFGMSLGTAWRLLGAGAVLLVLLLLAGRRWDVSGT